ncbi:hypothetical protein AAFF_G00214190 [Aldrovandia affinis]|uniref:Uncharacterized protein n=1 Tax=Aldrovandia affinis TaxID=143900 RepID=A0AAD7W5Q5_9TELE|nr:hypothetical protein AAFF_G00214190 [Aldrovandia affinis]
MVSLTPVPIYLLFEGSAQLQSDSSWWCDREFKPCLEATGTPSSPMRRRHLTPADNDKRIVFVANSGD